MQTDSTPFTPVCSRNRLRFVQSLCHKRTTDPRAVQERPTAILVVPGEDGRYNAGSQALLKYLLLGASGDELGEPTIDYADQPLEDLAFVISEDGVAVYHPTGLPGDVDAHLDMWRNVTLHTVLPQDMEQREEVELFKIKAFIDMVKGAAYVGAPLTGGWSRDGVVKDATTFDQFEIEGWPLVQAYGIADFGTGGFFTMNHRVVNVTPLLQSLYAHVDAHFVKRLVHEVVPALEGHWATSVQVLDVARSRPRRLRLTEQVVADALVTHYDFGRLRSSKLADRGARVVFGARTNDQTSTASAASVATSGAGETEALHFTVEAEDPSTGVRACRTYFLRGGHAAHLPKQRSLVADEDDDDAASVGGQSLGGQEESKGAPSVVGASTAVVEDPTELTLMQRLDAEPGTRDARFLLRAYELVLEALRRATAVLQSCAQDLGAAGPKCLDAAFDVFAPSASAPTVLPLDFNLGDNLDVVVAVMDGSGRTIDAAHAAAGHRRLLVYVKVSLLNLPSQEVAGRSLGALVAGDTALVGPGPAPFVLTHRIPARSVWCTSNVEAQASGAVDRALSSQAAREVLGVGVPKGEPLHHAVALLACPTWPSNLVGTLRVFDGGFSIVSPRQAPIVVSIRDHVVGVRIVPAAKAASAIHVPLPGSADAEAAVASWAEGPPSSPPRVEVDSGDVLVVELNDRCTFLPGARFVGLLLARGSGVKFAVVDVLSTWQHAIRQRDIDHPPAAPATWSGATLPADLCAAYEAAAYRSWQWTFRSRQLVEAILVADAFRGCPVSPEAAAVADAGDGDDGAGVGASSIPVVVVTGAPGSGKTRVAAALAEFSGDEFHWALVQQPLAAGIVFDAVSLQADVAKAAAHAAAHARPGHPPCIAVVSAGYADVVAVASAVRAVAGVHVAACIGCVHLRNLHWDQRKTRLLPRMLEQFSRGWATHAAILGCEDVPIEELDRMKLILRGVNPDLSIIRLNGGLGRGITVDASTIKDVVNGTYMNTPRAATFRNLTCPGWHVAHTSAEFRAEARSRRASVADELERMDRAVQARSRWRATAAAIDGVRPLPSALGAVYVDTPAVFHPRRLRKVVASLVVPCKDPVAYVLGITGKMEMDQLSLVDTDTSRTGLQVWRLKAFVRVLNEDDPAAPPALVQVDAVPGVVRVHPIESHQRTGSAPKSEFVFIGHALSEQKLKQRVMQARPRLLEPLQPRTVESLSAKEVAAIRTANLNAPLPGGTWFDGHQYMDHTGIPTPNHPHMERFLDEYVAKENAAIAAHNVVAHAQAAAAEAELHGSLAGDAWWATTAVSQPSGEDAHADVGCAARCAANDDDLDDIVLPQYRTKPVTGVAPPASRATQVAAQPVRPPTAPSRRPSAPPAPSPGQAAPVLPPRRPTGGGSSARSATAYSRRRANFKASSSDQGVEESKGHAV